MKKILLTGATGLIGKRIANKLIERGDEVTVFTRSVDKARRVIPDAAKYVDWNYNNDDWQINLEGADGVIHLAGQNVMARRWNKEHKNKILKSRIDSTRALVNAIGKVAEKPKVFISASATGFYGSSEEPVTEESLPGKDFLAGVVIAWENEAKKIDRLNIRRVNIRTGIVLDKNEGALYRMIKPFNYFAGGPLGTGKQWFPWIHIEDVAGIFLHALDNENVEGILNAVSPHSIRMDEFCKSLGKVMNRPSLIKVPVFLIRLIFGEGAYVLITGARVIPKRTLEFGYKYKFENEKNAVMDLLNR